MVLKKWEASLIIGLVITILLSTVSFFAECGGIRQSVLRLHILANSDSEEDQALKLKIRDRLLAEGADLFARADDAQQAEERAKAQLPRLQAAAEDEIARQGYRYPVRVEVAPSRFETRTYDTVTLPAGEYEAVRVLIGDAAGHNWWCVMFPPMCLPAAQPEQEVSDVLSGSQTDIVEHEKKYRVEFKIVEWFETVKSWF